MCERHGLLGAVRALVGETAIETEPLVLPAPMERPASNRRRKLWEIESKYLCPVVGTCLSLDDIKRVARKDGFAGKGFDDYRLHVEAVSVAGERNSASAVLHKTLERKHALAIKAFDQAKDAPSVAALWRQHLERGQVAGALWAVMTHKAASAETRSQVYGDVHMLSHQVGAGLAADARRLAFLEGEVARLESQRRQEEARHNQELAARASRIRFLEEDNQRLLAQVRAAAELDARLQALESGQVMVEMGRRLLLLEAANKNLREQAVAAGQYEVELKQLRLGQDRLNRERDTLAAERDALERLLLADSLPGPGCDEPCDSQCDACPDHLRGRCVLCVGGRATLLPQYRQLAERLGVRLIHHDGGREEAMSRLPELLAASDAVICPTDCVSHPAYYQLKRHCKQTGKPCVLARGSGIASFAAALNRLAEGRVEISARTPGVA